MRTKTLILAAAILAAVNLILQGQAAALSKEEAERKVAEDFGVEVLAKHTRAGEIEGRAVWLLTVMNPGGTFNEAPILAEMVAAGELPPVEDLRRRPLGLADLFPLRSGRADDDSKGQKHRQRNSRGSHGVVPRPDNATVVSLQTLRMPHSAARD